MILTNNQQEFLSKCIGVGPVDRASLIIFANELGTAGARDTEHALQRLNEKHESGPICNIGEGFSLLNVENPINSTFIQFVARLCLALKYKNSNFFDKLSYKGVAVLNNYILNELYKTENALVNIKPFPQSTERHWAYDNLNEKEYYRLYNFILKKSINNSYKELRVKILKEVFDLNKDSLILGVGDKHNKKAFFEYIYPNIIFEEHELDTIKIFVSRSPKIILSNYYDHRSGIKLSGLKQIYNFIIENLL